MAVTYGFFNAVDDDRAYNADQMSMYFEGLISEGIFESVGDKLRVTAGDGMTVNVGSGRAIVRSRWLKNDVTLPLTIAAASETLNRIDAVILKLDMTARTITIEVKQGEPVAGVPNAPAYTRTSDVYELWLATVRVNKNTAAITQDMITDFRPSALCGYVTGLINQVDTSTLYAQWEAAYEQYYARTEAIFNAYMLSRQALWEEWFSSLTDELRVDTTLRNYQNTVNTYSDTNAVLVGIPQYASDSDMLSVYANGVYMVQGADYTISGTGESAKILLTKTLAGQNSVTFVVIKSVIGEGSGAYIAGQTALETAAQIGIQGNATREDI